jgi:ABC-type nitrate/sulfonate/bicarbonate transport system permease component
MIRLWISRIWLPAFALGVWQLATSLGWLDPLFFCSPAHLVLTAWQLTVSGEILRHLSATLVRFFAAFAIGCGAGISTGLILGSLPFWRRSMESLFTGLNATPKLVLLPAFLVLFGMNDGARLMPAAISCFVLTAVYSMDAARAVKQSYLDLARSYGLGRRALFLRIYLPACLPSLFTGMRLSLGNALVMVVATEIVAAPTGLGSFIWITSQTLALDRTYVGIACCTLVGVTQSYLFSRLERRITPWVS